MGLLSFPKNKATGRINCYLTSTGSLDIRAPFIIRLLISKIHTYKLRDSHRNSISCCKLMFFVTILYSSSFSPDLKPVHSHFISQLPVDRIYFHSDSIKPSRMTIASFPQSHNSLATSDNEIHNIQSLYHSRNPPISQTDPQHCFGSDQCRCLQKEHYFPHCQSYNCRRSQMRWPRQVHSRI